MPGQAGLTGRPQRVSKILDGRNSCSIPVEVEITSEPSQEHTQELETNEELETLSSSVLDPTSVPETHIPELEGSDDEEEYLDAQAQALKIINCLEIG
ncbi:hypothetical protein M9H77_17723 [Catharanthus roseus]|uniref:Uncharacterized protein n=1 Tax=Catharanthus roseus TaxID=4058 RepID=A0ACC0B5D9_CATRO|nr:hypothetical protein M9H77_17723 [Catharanthus roseus]